MAPSADAQALLELLLRGQSYADIASLLDVPEEEVRARAREALEEIGGADPDRNVALTDWILGQADPIGRADAARHLREHADDRRLALALIASLRELAPEATLPRVPGEPDSGRLRRRPSREASPGRLRSRLGRGRLSSLTSSQSRALLALACAGVIVIAVVLAVTGVFAGDDDSPPSAATGNSETEGEADESDTTEDIQTVRLRPSSGGDARGSATFAIAGGQQAFVEVDIQNLEPAPAGEAYVLWLLTSEGEGHPLTPFQVDQGGTYSEQIPIAAFLTELAARTRFVDVSLSPREPLLDAVAEAVEENSPIIPYTGESILRGSVRADPPEATG